MERRVNDMAASVARKDISATLEKHLTDDFHAGSRDKRGFIELAEQLARAHGVDKVTVWDFNLVEIDREKGTARFHFMAKPICADRETPWYLIKAQFVRTSKGNWSEEWISGNMERSKGGFQEERVWERDPLCDVCGGSDTVIRLSSKSDNPNNDLSSTHLS